MQHEPRHAIFKHLYLATHTLNPISLYLGDSFFNLHVKKDLQCCQSFHVSHWLTIKVYKFCVTGIFGDDIPLVFLVLISWTMCDKQNVHETLSMLRIGSAKSPTARIEALMAKFISETVARRPKIFFCGPVNIKQGESSVLQGRCLPLLAIVCRGICPCSCAASSKTYGNAPFIRLIYLPLLLSTDILLNAIPVVYLRT